MRRLQRLQKNNMQMNGDHNAYAAKGRSRFKLVAIIVAISLIIAAFVMLSLWENPIRTITSLSLEYLHIVI